jgi:hypothetical protein
VVAIGSLLPTRLFSWRDSEKSGVEPPHSKAAAGEVNGPGIPRVEGGG